MRKELMDRIREDNQEYKRIESLLLPLGFVLNCKDVFYGERPFSLYCGKMKDYQKFVDNLEDIKKEYERHKKETLGVIPERSNSGNVKDTGL